METTIEQMNEVIALFDGWLPDYGGQGSPFYWKPCGFIPKFSLPDEMKFHESWDWLMEVVEKIESLENKRFGVCIDVLDTMIMDYKVGPDQGERIVVQTDIYPDNGDTKISITHKAVYQFIQWLNQNKNQ